MPCRSITASSASRIRHVAPHLHDALDLVGFHDERHPARILADVMGHHVDIALH